MTHKVLHDTVSSHLSAVITSLTLAYSTSAMLILLFLEDTKLVATTGPLHLPYPLPGTLAPENYHMACSLTSQFSTSLNSLKKISLPPIVLFPSFPAKFYYLTFLDNIYLCHKFYIYIFPVFPTSI